jgi:hypothetical protein
VTFLLACGFACIASALVVAVFGSIDDVRWLVPIYGALGTTFISGAVRLRGFLLQRRLAVLRAQIAEAERILAMEKRTD